MRITEVKDRTPLLIEQLLKVWEDSVKKTQLRLLRSCPIRTSSPRFV